MKNLRLLSVFLLSLSLLVFAPLASAKAKPAHHKPANHKPAHRKARPTRVSLAKPPLLTVHVTGNRQVKLTWGKVKSAYGYRVYRNNAVVGQTRRLSISAKLDTGVSYRFTVKAATSRGRLGRAANLTVSLAHQTPGTPTGLGVTASDNDTVNVTWNPVAETSAPIAAYRVFRDGAVVGQTTKLAMLLSNLTPLHSYQVQVAAVDTQGYLSALSAPITVNTQRPAQSAGSMRLFVMTDISASIQTFQAHYQQVAEIYPTYFDCNTKTGAITGTDDAYLTNWAQTRGVRVLPRVNCQNPTIEHQIFTNPLLEQQTITAITNLVSQYGYQGINLDFEGGLATDENAYTAFVGDLASALHAEGAELSIDVSPKLNIPIANQPRAGIYDYEALPQEADEIMVMTWGKHWTTSVPGPGAPLPWYTQVAQYAATMPNHNRFYMTMGSYAYDWIGNGGTQNPASELTWPALQALIAQTGATPTLDPASDEMTFTYTDAQGNLHTVWYDDGQTLADRFATAAANGLGGYALWYAGQGDPSLWNDLPPA